MAELSWDANRELTLEDLNLAVDHPGTPFTAAADTLALVRAVDSPYLASISTSTTPRSAKETSSNFVREAVSHVGEIQVH